MRSAWEFASGVVGVGLPNGWETYPFFAEPARDYTVLIGDLALDCVSGDMEN